MRLSVLLALVSLGGWLGAAETRNVSTVDELVAALTELGSGSNTGNTIYIEPGQYDVSSCEMAGSFCLTWVRISAG